MEWDPQFGHNLRRRDSTGSVNQNLVWKELWKCKLPAKLKIFAWKTLHGILPCLGVLSNQHITTNNSCPLCAGSREDIKHTLFLCDGAKEIWKRMGVWNIVTEACAIDRSGSAVQRSFRWEPR
uniref:Uncharacterized protein n=1 Tax=Avena sativa TaxID=4498 RepID=A0ACD5XFM1_AVESA